MNPFMQTSKKAISSFTNKHCCPALWCRLCPLAAAVVTQGMKELWKTLIRLEKQDETVGLLA